MSELKRVMEYLLEHRACDLPPPALGDLFDRMVWYLDDNGEELCAIRTEWLHSNDRAKVEVALATAEIFPCNSRAEMVDLFDSILEKWPALQSTCDAWLDTWDKQSLQS